MDKLFPIVRRVRRPLLPEEEPRRRRDVEGTCVPATALRASDTETKPGPRGDARPPETEVPGESPETTGESPVPPGQDPE